MYLGLVLFDDNLCNCVVVVQFFDNYKSHMASNTFLGLVDMDKNEINI